MGRYAIVALLTLAAWCLFQAQAHAQTRVRVVDTWPAGTDVRLARNQNFHLRLAYETDEPVGIWVHAYHRGKEANVGSSPSPRVTGRGEAMGWFFFMQPGDEVDEIRIVAGDGSRGNTPVVATWRGRIVAGGEAAAATDEPRWVVDMREQARLAQQRDHEARMAALPEPGAMVLAGGFMLAMLALAVVGIGAPLWAIRRWHGGWRLAAMVPAALMAFVVLRIVVGVALDPSSHNLWPFEIAMAAGISAVVMLALVVVRRLSGTGRRG